MFKNNKKKFNNLGFYIEYTLIDPKLTYESINESSFMIRNIDRTSSKLSNLFEWKNIIDNKIKYLLYIYIHILSIPIRPFLDKTIYTLFSANFISNLIVNNQIDINYTADGITYQVAFINSDIIDFIIDNNYTQYYSYEIKTNKTYLYTRSTRTITNEPFIYLNIDSNDNLSNNTSYNTSKLTNNFSFKLIPIFITSNYVFYKALKQYILKTIATIQSIDTLTITLSDSTNKKLVNNQLNTNLYQKKNLVCNCTEDTKFASCYCTYIRHPSNPNSQIDIGFKIGQIQNELINNIFY
jgi:hypothetical protein